MADRVDKRPGTKRGSAEWAERVSRGVQRGRARTRERRRVRASDLAEIRSGAVPASESVRPHVAAEMREAEDVLLALGGADRVSPQRKALVHDWARLGVALRVELAHFAANADHDAIPRLTSLVNSRRALLSAVGLDRFEDDALDVGSYRAALAAQGRHQRANGVESDAVSPSATEDAAERDDASEGDA